MKVNRAAGVGALCALAVAAAVGLYLVPEARLTFCSARGANLDLSQAVADLETVRFVFVGESHDNREHHWAQLAILRALRRAGVPLALGLEMFRRDAQPQLDRWTAGTLSRPAFVSLFADHWDVTLWSVYADLFDFAREEHIPMVALNVPREIVTRVAEKGFASLSAEQRDEVGTVECNVDPRYRRLLGALLGVEEKSGAHFERFCEAQLVWDVAMARTLLAYGKKNPQRTVVVLTGVFHAWKHGIPAQIARRSTLPCRVILPFENERLADYAVALRDADYLWRRR